MRCPNCNKFVAYDEQDPEVQSLEVDSDGIVSIAVRIVKPCADCGTELKEATLEGEVDLTAVVEQHATDIHSDSDAALVLSVDEEACDNTERSEGTGRGQKTYYGAELAFSVTCDDCKETIAENQKWSDEIQASSMDEV